MWNYVIPHFKDFLNELELSPQEQFIAYARAYRVADILAAKYYPDQPFDPNCFLKVGSFGKGTATRPRTDLDLLFILPDAEFGRINSILGNSQSYLLQEVKRTLAVTYPNTDLRGSGPVVEAPFDTYHVDIVPVFKCSDGTFLTAHTKDGGNWKRTNPLAEAQWLKEVDGRSLGKATHLIKMLKAWKRQCNVEIRSICLETAAIVFVDQWVYRDKTICYYDWMIRDFFAFMLRFVDGGRAKPAGIDEWIEMGDCWQSKCQTAFERSSKACEYEHADLDGTASLQWRLVFGPQIKLVSLPRIMAGISA